jgi:hypothetical protein
MHSNLSRNVITRYSAALALALLLGSGIAGAKDSSATTARSKQDGGIIFGKAKSDGGIIFGKGKSDGGIIFGKAKSDGGIIFG